MHILTKYAHNTYATCHFSIKKIIKSATPFPSISLSFFFFFFLKKKVFFFSLVFNFFLLKNDMWHGYYEHILLKWAFFSNVLVVWEAGVGVLTVCGASCKTGGNLWG
jgi:hypothetical protein